MGLDLVQYLAERRAINTARPVPAPTGALAGPNWLLPNYPQQEMWDSDASIRIAYCQCGYIYRAASLIADIISGLPFHVTNNAQGNGNNPSDPLAMLLGPAPGGPNPQWTSAQMWRYTIIQRVITGKFAWRIGRDPSTKQIKQLWPLMAQHIQPIANRNLRIASYFDSYWYFPRGHQSHEEFKLDDIVYAWRPSQKDVRQAESVLESSAINVKTLLLLNAYDEAFISNGGVPAYIVTTPQFATQTEREAFRAQFNARFSGPRNAGKAIFAEHESVGDFGGKSPTSESIDVKSIGISQKDSQNALTRDANIKAILDGMGVPMSLISDSSDRTFSNAAQENRNFMATVIHPLIREIQDDINRRLAPLVGDGTGYGYFDISEVPALKPVPNFTGDQGLHFVQSHLLDRDEWRRDNGLPPAETVKTLDENGEMTTLDKLPVGAPMMGRVSETAKLDASGNMVPDTSTPLPPAIEQPVPVRSWHRAMVFKAHPEACEICKDANGTIDPDFDGYDLPHPNCVCSVEVDNPTERGFTFLDAKKLRKLRHRGPDGHDHVITGHDKKKTLERVLSTSLNQLMDEQTQAAQARLSGRRGRRATQLAATSPDGIFNQETATSRFLTVLSPILAEIGDDDPLTFVEPVVTDIYNRLSDVYAAGATEEAIMNVFESIKETVNGG